MQRARKSVLSISLGLILAAPVCLALGTLGQELRPRGGSTSSTPTDSDAGSAAMRDAVNGIKSGEHALYLYERIERLESRKDSSDTAPQSVRVSRVVPSG